MIDYYGTPNLSQVSNMSPAVALIDKCFAFYISKNPRRQGELQSNEDFISSFVIIKVPLNLLS